MIRLINKVKTIPMTIVLFLFVSAISPNTIVAAMPEPGPAPDSVSRNPMVELTQKYLNETYSSNPYYTVIPEDSIPNNTTMKALVTALQIELGVSINATTAGSFGEATLGAFSNLPGGSFKRDDDKESNLAYLLQGALWCNGYSTGANDLTPHFRAGTENAVKAMQRDAGLVQDGIVTPQLMKALMSTDAYVLMSGGNAKIRQLQQELNRKYSNVRDGNKYLFGVMPCDGIFAKATSMALIYDLQMEQGLAPYPITANGNFGPSTRANCPEINSITAASLPNFIKIAKYALLWNGYDTGIINGVYNQAFTSAVKKFQEFCNLPQTGVVNTATWASLFISYGDKTRKGGAADCATILDTNKAQKLKSLGFDYVGRYLTGFVGTGANRKPKNLTIEEINIIHSVGIRIFPIYQDGGWYQDYFSEEQGRVDAEKAIQSAVGLRIPRGTVIYFAVDCDMMNDQVTNLVIPYFKGINETMGSTYKIGIYGARNVCTRVSERGYAEFSFVSDMSSGFSGNIGYPLPKNWAFDQFFNSAADASFNSIYRDTLDFEIDSNIVSGRDKGFGHLISQSADINVLETETFAKLAEDSYRTLSNSYSYNGWSLATAQVYRTSRFSCSIFENDNSIVYAFRGTPFPEDFSLFTDWYQTLAYYLPSTNSISGYHKQRDELYSFLNEEVKIRINSGKDIYFTGHSLGGWLSLQSYLWVNSNHQNLSNRIKGVITFNTIGVAKNDEQKILEYYNPNQGTEIKNFYVCCDVARWYGKEKGFSFPGKNYIINEPHWSIGIKTEADGGSWYQHAHGTSSGELLENLAKIKDIAGSTPLSTGLRIFYYGIHLPYGDLPLDGLIPYPNAVRSAYTTATVRIDSHGHYRGLAQYAVPEGTTSPTRDVPAKVIVRIACPVDVELIHNEETLSNDRYFFDTSWGSLYLTGEDKDEKILVIKSEEELNILLTGKNSGSMNFYISFYDDITGELLSSTEYLNIALNTGKLFSTDIKGVMANEDIKLDIIDNNGRVIGGVLEDGTEWLNKTLDISVTDIEGNSVIEIHNISDYAISTKGLYLSNDDNDLFKWQMPSFIIRPNDLIIVKGNEDNATVVLKRAQTNFNITTETRLWLSDAKGSIVDDHG